MVNAMKTATAQGLITVKKDKDVAERIFPDVLDGGSTHADIVNAVTYDKYWRRPQYFRAMVARDWN